MKIHFFRTNDAGSGNRFFRTSDTGLTLPRILSASNMAPQRGTSLTLSMEDAGASQGTVTLGGVAQTITAWAAGSITLTVVRGTNRFGVALDLVVTRADAAVSQPLTLNSIQPQAGWTYINASTPNTTAANRLTAVADVVSGDQWAKGNVIGTGIVTINPDSTFTADAGVTAFDVELWSAGNGWGSVATQTITTPDLTPPTGYSVSFNQAVVNNANKAAIGFTFSGAEVGCTYNYSISSSGGGSVATGSGTISTSGQAITGLNLTGLSDGLLTLTARLTDPSGNVGGNVTATVVKDVALPTVTPPSNTIIQYNYGAAGLSRSSLAVQSWLAQAIAVDGANGPLAVTNNINSLSDPIAAGVYTVTFSAVDGAGNPNSATAQLTVQEAAAPPVDTGEGAKYFRSLLRNLLK